MGSWAGSGEGPRFLPGQVLQRFVEQILGCGRPCVLQRRVPAVQEVRVEGASDSVLPQSVGHSSCDAETGTYRANLHAPGAVSSWRLLTCPLDIDRDIVVNLTSAPQPPQPPQGIGPNTLVFSV